MPRCSLLPPENSLLLSNFVLIGSKAYERRRKIVLGGQTQKYQRAGEQMSVFIFLWGYAHRYLCIDRNVLQLQRWGVPKWVKIYLELHSIKEKGNWFVHLRMVSISLPLSGNLWAGQGKGFGFFEKRNLKAEVVAARQSRHSGITQLVWPANFCILYARKLFTSSYQNGRPAAQIIKM